MAEEHSAEIDAPRCRTCHGSGWTGARHDAGEYSGHFHCPCGAPCGVDRAEGCTGARDIPPAETGHGLPFDPPEADEPTCPTCGQALFTHGIVGRCTPPGAQS